MHNGNKLFKQSKDVLDTVIASLMVYVTTVRIRSLLDVIPIFPAAITRIANVCLDKHHHHRFSARICGSLSLPYNQNGMRDIWWVLPLLDSATLDVHILVFQTMYSPYCQINYMEMHKQPKLAARNLTSRYCGFFPAWNESSPMSQLSLHLVITWPPDMINILLRYAIHTSICMIIYQGHRLTNIKSLYLYQLQYLGPFNTTTYLMITTQYHHIITYNMLTNMTFSTIKYLSIYDGPSTGCGQPPSRISSSHQLCVSIQMDSEHQTLFNFSSFPAPLTLVSSHITMNTSLTHTFYNTMVFSMILTQNGPFKFEIKKMQRYGFTGSHCEYSGVVLTNTIDNITDDYGPFCNQGSHEAYSVTSLRLPISDARIVLYGYSKYSNIFVEISLQEHQKYLGDVLPLWANCHRYERQYGQVQRVCNLMIVRWNLTVVPTMIYLLPELPTHEITPNMGLGLRHIMGAVDVKFLLRSTPLCQMDWSKLADKYNIKTKCAWVDPIVIIKRDIPKELLLVKGFNQVVPYSDITLRLNYDGSASLYGLYFMKQRETAYSYISTQNSSCVDMFTLTIDPKDAFDRYSHRHQFQLDEKFEWNSVDNNFKFYLRIFQSNHSCQMAIVHQSHDYSFCLRDWYNITPMCNQIWKNGDERYKLQNPLCHDYRCYTVLHGGSLSWLNAQAMCKKIHGDLISFDSHEEVNFIRMLFYSFLCLPNEKTFVYGIVPGSTVSM